MPDWRTLRVEGLDSIDRVVEVFQVDSSLKRLPFPSFKVKVLERPNGSFLAIPNVSVFDDAHRPDFEAGLGETSNEAPENALRRLMRLVNETGARFERDFCWSDPAEF